jgi:hypothetical protein
VAKEGLHGSIAQTNNIVKSYKAGMEKQGLGTFKRIKRDVSNVSKSSDATVDVGVKRGSESVSFDDKKNTKRGRSLDVNSDVIMTESESIVTVKETGKNSTTGLSKLEGAQTQLLVNSSIVYGHCSQDLTGTQDEARQEP